MDASPDRVQRLVSLLEEMSNSPGELEAVIEKLPHGSFDKLAKAVRSSRPKKPRAAGKKAAAPQSPAPQDRSTETTPPRLSVSPLSPGSEVFRAGFEQWYNDFKSSSNKLKGSYKLYALCTYETIEDYRQRKAKELNMELLQAYVERPRRAIASAGNAIFRNYIMYGNYWEEVYRLYKANTPNHEACFGVLSWEMVVSRFPPLLGEAQSLGTISRYRRMAKLAQIYPRILLGQTSVHKFCDYTSAFVRLLDTNIDEAKYWRKEPEAHVVLSVIPTAAHNHVMVLTNPPPAGPDLRDVLLAEVRMEGDQSMP